MKLKKLFLSVTMVGMVTGISVAAWLFWPTKIEPRNFDGLVGDVAKGAYLARASSCFACHTNTKENGAVFAGGEAMKTPFGTFYAPNITTNKIDGIGNWTLDNFSNALVHGVNPEGKNYYPVFLYPNYTSMSDQDIIDLWEAFKTVPAVSGKAPEHDLKFPFQYRFLLSAWKKLFFKSEIYKPNPEKSDQWNRGAYLATGPAHCSVCHSPKNPFGGIDDNRLFEGDDSGEKGKKVPPIAADYLSKQNWEISDIVFSLKTGTKPDGDVFGDSMGKIVTEGTRFLTDEDLNAIAQYIMSNEY